MSKNDLWTASQGRLDVTAVWWDELVTVPCWSMKIRDRLAGVVAYKGQRPDLVAVKRAWARFCEAVDA